ncbi:MAG: alpha amylase C-terminal domain-containing protein [Eubacteriales bacterium]|nr:alpha amylase C-terminal domain-containing protein [Eubacteriales bacterium]
MDRKLYKMMNWAQIEAVIYSDTDRPDLVLGAQQRGSGVLVQAFFPWAAKVWIVPEESGQKQSSAQPQQRRIAMELADEDGFFAAFLPNTKASALSYRYEIETPEGELVRQEEVYRFRPFITPEEEGAFHAGVAYEIYEKLGAHPMTVGGTEGVAFALYAPHAARVSVVGDFNGWDGRLHQMVREEESDFFQLFVPGVKAGMFYKFEIKLRSGVTFLKSDPYAFGSEEGAGGASIVRAVGDYAFGDQNFVKKRGQACGGSAPVSICEVPLDQFAGKYRYGELAMRLCAYVKSTGHTHVLLSGLAESLCCGGRRVTRSFYAPREALGTPEELQALVGLLHHRGIGVLAALSPASFYSEDPSAMAGFDGEPLYESGDPLRDGTPEGGALYFDYGKPEVSNFLIANAMYWVEQYHFDGLLLGDIARMLYLDYGKAQGQYRPNLYGGKENPEAVELLRHLNSMMARRNPGVLMIAEDSSGWPGVTAPVEEGGLGFHLKSHQQWELDMARYFSTDPYFRRGAHDLLLDHLLYQYAEHFLLPLQGGGWLGAMPGEESARYANLRLLIALQMMHPGKKLLSAELGAGAEALWPEETEDTQRSPEDVSAGTETAEHAACGSAAESSDTETAEASAQNVSAVPSDDAVRRAALKEGLLRMIADLHILYKEQSALTAKDASPDGFQWVRHIANDHCVLSFVRRGKTPDDFLLVVCNPANAPWEEEIGVPYAGGYKEIFNTDRESYGGEGAGNARMRQSRPGERDERSDYIRVQCPPLSLLVFSYRRK